MYRATPITQQDGSSQANSNCRMASAATGLDFDTLGKKTSTGKKMRDYSGDPEGGTTADDAVQAWDHYDEVLSVRNGKPWSEVVASLREGRLVHLDVWAHTCGGPCSTGNVGHTIAVAPEQNSDGKWLTMDPWCKPAKWVWWSESKLRNGAEEWADRCGWRSASMGGPRSVRDMTPAQLAAIVKVMMTFYSPDSPLDPADDDYVPSTLGSSAPCLWTRTAAHPEGSDVAIRVSTSVKSANLLHCPEGLAWYADAALTQKKGNFNSARDLVYIGLPYKENSRAVIVKTSAFNGDDNDESEPVICYVDKDDVGSSFPAPVPPPADPCTQRDAEWRAWLEAAPSGLPEADARIDALEAWQATAPDKITPTGATAGVEAPPDADADDAADA